MTWLDQRNASFLLDAKCRAQADFKSFPIGRGRNPDWLGWPQWLQSIHRLLKYWLTCRKRSEKQNARENRVQRDTRILCRTRAHNLLRSRSRGSWWCGITAEDECGCGKLNWIWSVGRMDDSLDTGFHRGKRTTYIDPSASWCLRISGTSSQVYSILNTRPGGSGIKPSGPAWYRLLVFSSRTTLFWKLYIRVLWISRGMLPIGAKLKCPFDPRVEVRIMGVRKQSPNS